MQLNVDTDSIGTNVNAKLITFKSSPNFKNMKKFLKSRMGDADTSSMLDSPESPMHQDEIQPPLPLDPPPPDEMSPAKYSLSPNDEMDDKSLLLTMPKQECASPEPEIKCEVPIEYVEETKPPKPICKDFIRSSCSRVGCKYRHEIDLTQLRGIFIFCHNFQNSVCNKPNCRYVHASVFEEQRFYRTGELPKVLVPKPEAAAESTFSSESQKFMLPPPPPPPPPPTTESEAVKEPANTFVLNVSKPPPQLVPKPEQQLINGIYNQNPIINIETKSPRIGTKRPWSESDEGISELFNCPSPQDSEPRAKRNNDGKCGSCKVMEYRLKFAMDKLKDVMRSAAESELKMLKLQRRHKFLLQLAAALTNNSLNARHNERDNVGQTNSIFMQLDLQQALQQSSAVSVNLTHLNEDHKKLSPLASNLAAQLKQLMQTPPLYNKINNSDDNGSKVLLAFCSQVYTSNLEESQIYDFVKLYNIVMQFYEDEITMNCKL